MKSESSLDSTLVIDLIDSCRKDLAWRLYLEQRLGDDDNIGRKCSTKLLKASLMTRRPKKTSKKRKRARRASSQTSSTIARSNSSQPIPFQPFRLSRPFNSSYLFFGTGYERRSKPSPAKFSDPLPRRRIHRATNRWHTARHVRRHGDTTPPRSPCSPARPSSGLSRHLESAQRRWRSLRLRSLLHYSQNSSLRQHRGNLSPRSRDRATTSVAISPKFTTFAPSSSSASRDRFPAIIVLSPYSHRRLHATPSNARKQAAEARPRLALCRLFPLFPYFSAGRESNTTPSSSPFPSPGVVPLAGRRGRLLGRSRSRLPRFLQS